MPFLTSTIALKGHCCRDVIHKTMLINISTLMVSLFSLSHT